MSINLHVYARGKIITPSGMTVEHSEPFNLIQTTTETSYAVMDKKTNEERCDEYYRHHKNANLKLWVKQKEEEGFEIVWYIS